MSLLIFCLTVGLSAFAHLPTIEYHTPIRDVADYGKLDSYLTRVKAQTKLGGEWGYVAVEKSRPSPSLGMGDAERALQALKQTPHLKGIITRLNSDEKIALLNAAHVYLSFLGVEHSIVSFVPADRLPLWKLYRFTLHNYAKQAPRPEAIWIHKARSSKLGRIAKSIPGALIFDPDMQMMKGVYYGDSVSTRKHELSLDQSRHLAISPRDLIDLQIRGVDALCAQQF